jgi:hypothetical protein
MIEKNSEKDRGRESRLYRFQGERERESEREGWGEIGKEKGGREGGVVEGGREREGVR